MSTVTRYVMMNPYTRAMLMPDPYQFTTGFRIHQVTCQSAPYGQRVEDYLINWANSLRDAYNIHVKDVSHTWHAESDAGSAVTTTDCTSITGACTLINSIRTAYNSHIAKTGIPAPLIHEYADTSVYNAGTTTPPVATDENSLFVLLEWVDRAFMRHRLAVSSGGTHQHGVSDDWENSTDCVWLQGYKLSRDGLSVMFSSVESTSWVIPEIDKLDLGSVGFVLDFSTKIPWIYNRLEMILYAKVIYEDISGTEIAQVGSIEPIQSLVGVYSPTSGPGGV